MKKINIREALLDIDRRTNAEYDLTTLYEACKLSEDDKKKVVQYIDSKEPPFMIGEFLASKCDAVCESICGDDEVSEADMKKIVDDINDGGDHTLWALMDKADKLDEAVKTEDDWDVCPECGSKSLEGGGDGRAVCSKCNTEVKVTPAANNKLNVNKVNESADSREVRKQVYRMISDSDKLTSDDSRYWDFERCVDEGDDAVIIQSVEEAPKTAMYQFSLMDDGVDLDLMLDRMSNNDTWYIIDNSNTKYGDNDDSLNEDIISVDTADLENKIRAAATDVVVNKLGYDEGFADKYVVIEVGNTDEEDARVRVEVRADLSYEEAQEVADALNPIVKEYDKDAYFDAVTHNTIEAYIRLDQSDDIVDEEVFNYWKSIFDKVTTRGDLINYYKELVRKRDEGSITWGTMDKLFDEVIGPLNDRLDAENAPKVEESLDEAAVGTMERPMTQLQGTLSSILSSDWNAWAKIRHVEDAVVFLDEIAPQCRNKGYIEKVKSKLLSNPRTNIQQFFTNIIMAGDGQGVVKTGKSARIARDRKELGESTEDIQQYMIVAHQKGTPLYYNVKDNTFSTDMNNATRYAELEIANSDLSEISKSGYDDVFVAPIYDLPLLDKEDLHEASESTSLYLFPELTAEDLEMVKAYGLTYLGKNHGPDGSENNCVVAGDMSSLQRYADKYLGYELHPDYLYDDADDFAGDIIKEEVELTICPNCGEERFNDNTGLCVDCGYDEKGYGDLDESTNNTINNIELHKVEDDFMPNDADYDKWDRMVDMPEAQTIAPICYTYGVTWNKAIDYLAELSDEEIEHANKYYELRGLPTSIRLKAMSKYKARRDLVNESKSINEDIESETIISQVQDFINSDESLVNIINYLFTCDCTPDEVIRLLVDRFDCQEVLVKDTLADDFGIEVGSRYVESKSIEEDADNWSFDKAVDWLTDIAVDQYLDSPSTDGAYRNAVGLALDHETLPAVLNTQESRKKIMQIAPKMVASKYSAKIHKNKSKSLKEDADERFTLVRTKSVPDSDGFNTDYTMYYDHDNDKYVFVFGDRDIYTPEDGYFDWESETIEQAYQWFDSYNGFADEEDEEYSFELDEGIFKDIKNVAKAAGSAIKNSNYYKNNIQPKVDTIKKSDSYADLKALGGAVKKSVGDSSVVQKAKGAWNHDKSMHEVETAIKNATSKTALLRKVKPMYNSLKKDGILTDKDDARFKALMDKKLKQFGVTNEAVEDSAVSAEEVARQMKEITHNFADEFGYLQCGFESEQQAAYDVLKQHYADVNTGKRGNWFWIDFNEKIEAAE